MKPERTKEAWTALQIAVYAVNCSNTDEYIDEVARLIEEYRRLGTSPVESKWVSVKERTPEFDGKYLCFIEAPQECGNIWRFQEVVDLHFNEWITSEDQYVTHWKPLDPNP